MNVYCKIYAKMNKFDDIAINIIKVKVKICKNIISYYYYYVFCIIFINNIYYIYVYGKKYYTI